MVTNDAAAAAVVVVVVVVVVVCDLFVFRLVRFRLNAVTVCVVVWCVCCV